MPGLAHLRWTGALALLLLGCEEKPAATAADHVHREPGASVELPEPPRELDAKAFCAKVFGARSKALARQCAHDPNPGRGHDFLEGEAKKAGEVCERVLGMSTKRGRAVLSEKAAAACAGALSEADWRDTFSTVALPSWLDACAGAVQGRQAADEACTTSLECEDGLTCQPNAAAIAIGMRSERSWHDEPGDVALRWRELDDALGVQDDVADAGASEGGLGNAVDPGERSGIGLSGAVPPKPSSGASVRVGRADTTGRLPREVIRRIVRHNFARYRFCYEKGLIDDPSLHGRVIVRFVIAADGKVSSVERGAATSLPNETVVDCVKRAFRALTFPAPDGGVVTVTYPIIFSAADSDPVEPDSTGTSSSEEPRLSCAPAKKVRAPRSLGAEKPCVEHEQCVIGHYCADDEGTCQPTKKTGEPCTTGAHCAGVCGHEGKCVALCGAG